MKPKQDTKIIFQTAHSWDMGVAYFKAGLDNHTEWKSRNSYQKQIPPVTPEAAGHKRLECSEAVLLHPYLH